MKSVWIAVQHPDVVKFYFFPLLFMSGGKLSEDAGADDLELPAEHRAALAALGPSDVFIREIIDEVNAETSQFPLDPLVDDREVK